MNWVNNAKSFIGGVTEIGLMLLALGIVAALMFGANVPFIGSVVPNLLALIQQLGSAGLVGLIALGIILWLFSKRTLS